MGNDFYHQALTPAILFARESLNFSLQRFGVLRQDTGLPGECLIRNTHSYLGMRANVSHPIGSRILSYDVVTTRKGDKPDFNLARQATPPATRSQVEVLLAVLATFL